MARMANSYNHCDQYDVFLSFRGSDTRLSFTDHVYAALERAGIRTFRDDDELERGERLKPQLEEAINSSAISIIVFSPNYASSEWCLDEVVMILERKMGTSKHKVLPVFYHVSPADVRHQFGSFERAFGRHKEKADASTNEKIRAQRLEKIESWRTALKEAANLSGLHLPNDGYEATLINEIVHDIKKKLPIKLDLPKSFVGIKKQVKYVNDWIRDGSAKNNILVIWGMGGIGKTTVAKYAYMSNIRHFEAGSYLENIGNKAENLMRLQRQLLLDLSGRKEKIRNRSEGKEMIKRASCSKKPHDKYLIVLDDVTQKDHIEALLEPLEVCPNKKIIVTTRNMSLLNSFEVELYEVGTLGDEDALALFKSHAFREDHSMEDYMELSREMIHRCGNLPLALKVLGSSLYESTIDEWKERLQELNKVAEPDIQKVLITSYDSLPNEKAKKLFLRVACFFIGEDKDLAIKILDPCDLYPRRGLKTLIDRCLVTSHFDNTLEMHQLVHSENTLGMHQLVQAMAREIVRQESPSKLGKRSILCDDKDSFDVLIGKWGTDAVEGLILDVNKIEVEENNCDSSRTSQQELIKANAFSRMPNLTIVKLDHVILKRSCKRFPKKLVWIFWRNYPFESIPNDVSLNKLVVLDMQHSRLKRVWDECKVLGSLQILNLSYSVALEHTPDFNGLPGLERLILKGCTSLSTVSKSIGILKRLVLLNLKDCKNLRAIPSLPNSILTLKLSGWTSLDESRKEVIGEEEVSLDNQSAIPRRVTTLDLLPRSLVKLSLKCCNLSNNCFPWDGSGFSSLKYVDISDNLITHLPNFVGSLPALEALYVNQCRHLQSLVFPLTTLNHLDAYECDSLKVVKLTPSRIKQWLNVGGQSLEEVVGRFKCAPMGLVEKQVFNSLGLKSMAPSEIGKVRYEFGIYSALVKPSSDRDDLGCVSSWIESGSSISVEVPFSHPPKKILGFNVFSTFTCDDSGKWYDYVSVNVSNRTRDVNWIYYFTLIKSDDHYNWGTDVHWLSLWKCEAMLEPGDQLYVIIRQMYATVHVKECGIRIVYEEDLLLLHDDDNIITITNEEEEYLVHSEETTEYEQQQPQTNNMASPPPTRISWTDEMLVEISDHCASGTTSFFGDRSLSLKKGVFGELYMYLHQDLEEETRSSTARLLM